MADPNEELLTFFKAMADATRLKIVGLLAKEPLSVEQLAEMLNLSASTVSHHLSKLLQAGLVSVRPESYYNIYRLELQTMERMANRMLVPETYPAAAAGADPEAYDRKVVGNFTTRDGRLKTIPAQRKKLDAILRHVVQAFEPGVRFSERQVNKILSGFHEDTATLRRELVGAHLLQREGGGGEYWREEG